MSVATEETSALVAVTGASGFVGKRLMARLQERAATSRVDVVPFFGSVTGDPVAGTGSDIRVEKDVSDVVAALTPHAVIHLAAVAAPLEARRNPQEAWSANVLGTLNLASAILRHSPSTRLIFAGSSDAYGESFALLPGPLTEDAPLRPISPYGATKAAADLMLGQMAFDGLQCVRFRPFNHTGAGQSEIYVISSFARQVAMIERDLQPPVLKVGNLELERDFLDVRDVVEAYAEAALRPAALPAGTALNLSTGTSRRLRDILDMLIAMSDRDISVEIDPAKLRPGEVQRVEGDASAAARLLGWKPTIPFEETLRFVLDDWRRRLDGR